MGKLKFALAASAVLALTAAAAPANATVYVVSGSGGSANGSFLSSTSAPLSAIGKIAKVVIKLTGLSTPLQRDVVINLLHNGKVIQLAGGNGGTHDLAGDYTFDTKVSSTLLAAGALNGSDERIGDSGGAVYDFVSGSFAGLDAAGTYKLGLLDRGLDGSATTLAGWSLLIYVPEPATWAMMLGGFGFVGAMMRRRKPAKASLSLA